MKGQGLSLCSGLKRDKKTKQAAFPWEGGKSGRWVGVRGSRSRELCFSLPFPNFPAEDFPHRDWIWRPSPSAASYCCSVTKSCPTLCNPMDYSMAGSPVLHHLLEFAQIHVHWLTDAIQSSHPLSSHSPPAFNLSQHQGLFQWVSSSHQVAKVLERQLQHQSFQWIFRVDFI